MGTIDTIVRVTPRVRPLHTAPGPTALVPMWKRLWREYLDWRALQNSRVQLGKLSDEQLADIGVSRNEAVREARKARFWI